jgi:crotonobetainyl-CoA:carnitine CoA-transferase CaiB-like acyl-CoA transferase
MVRLGLAQENDRLWRETRILKEEKRAKSAFQKLVTPHQRLTSHSLSIGAVLGCVDSVPVGPINDLERVFDDPQVKARGMQTAPVDANGALLQGVASPLKLSKTPPVPPKAAPDLGADTVSVLTRLLDPREFDLGDLQAAGAVMFQGDKP